jgi:diguanylate cyclase (GGDEF)-like protein
MSVRPGTGRRLAVALAARPAATTAATPLAARTRWAAALAARPILRTALAEDGSGTRYHPEADGAPPADRARRRRRAGGLVAMAAPALALAAAAIAVPWPPDGVEPLAGPLRLALAAVAVAVAAWLLRRAQGRAQAPEERASWGRFAAVIRTLDEPDEEAVARAAGRGARQLFSADEVEIGVLRPDGRWRWYRDDRDASAAPDGPPKVGPGNAVSRPLRLGGTATGVLRLEFARPVRLTDREHLQLSVFGDAVAAALHDSAVSQKLRDLSDRGRDDAHRDTLTGTGNRAAMLAQGDAALQELERDAMVAFLLLDVDQFKEVNDTLGRAAGDQLLRVATGRINAWRGPGELVARLGGDEFGVLLTAVPAPAGDEGAARDHALRRARELSDLLAAPTEVSGMTVVVEASVGVAATGAGSCGMRELLRRAEIAMYRAKHDRSAVAWYDSSGDVGDTERLALAAELREALRSPDELGLVLQPIVDLRGGAPVAVEALVRWRHPRRGELLPHAFLDVLGDSKLLGPFTLLVLDRALAWAAEWSAHGLPVPVSVNLSPRSLFDTRLPQEVGELLARYKLPADRLILEITENAVVPESPAVTDVLAQLRRAGVRLAVDDFGTGYSSMTFLTRERVDEIKIDRSFVGRMTDSPEALAIVRTLIQLARMLGIRVVAEGVETVEQRALLEKLGCDAAQGYLFFAPMAPERVTDVLRERLAAAS